jgi:hypothetical protein
MNRRPDRVDGGESRIVELDVLIQFETLAFTLSNRSRESSRSS